MELGPDGHFGEHRRTAPNSDNLGSYIASGRDINERSIQLGQNGRRSLESFAMPRFRGD